MQTTKRQLEPGVIGRLEAQPHRFRCFQAINLLLGALQRQGVPYERAMRDVFRFRNNLSLAFPASEIASIEVERKGPDINRIHLTPAFIGLLGAAGTLPLHDSERLAEQQHLDHDTSQHALLDVFSNRMIGLFYETWGKYRVEHSLRVQGQDRLLPMLLALAGGRHAGKASTSTSRAAAYYAGIVRTRPVAASAIERVLCEHFAIPVRLEQFVGCWDPIPPARRSTLGRTAPVLGGSAVLGTRVWRHDLQVRLHVGPLDETQLLRFLPGGAARRALVEVIALFAAPMVRWELKLAMAPRCIGRLTLTSGVAPRQLGWNSFLTSTAGVTADPHATSMLAVGTSLAAE